MAEVSKSAELDVKPQTVFPAWRGTFDEIGIYGAFSTREKAVAYLAPLMPAMRAKGDPTLMIDELITYVPLDPEPAAGG